MPLVIETLTVTRGGLIVLSNVSARAESGETLTLMGRNGAGKTTLLRTIAGFLTPDQGHVRFRTSEATDDVPVAEQAHFVGHLDGVKGALTVAENARFWCAYLGGAAEQIDAALAQVGLTELSEIGARFLSAGQKRRLALVRVLLVTRPLWLLDEPAASLDAAGQTLLIEMAAAHLAAGGTIVAATHVDLGFPNTRALTLGGAGAL